MLRDPVIGIKPLKVERVERIVLSLEQVELLASSVPPRCRAMVVTQAGCGMRVGELLGLRVTDLDFDAGTIRIDRQLLDAWTRELRTPKTKAGRRTVPMPEAVRDALRTHMTLFSPLPSGFLFYGPRSHKPYLQGKYAHSVLREWVRRIAAVDPTFPDISSHCLRHGFITMMAGDGRAIANVSRWVGHASPVTTLRTYTHPVAGEDERARQTFDRAWRAVDGGRSESVPVGDDGPESAEVLELVSRNAA